MFDITKLVTALNGSNISGIKLAMVLVTGLGIADVMAAQKPVRVLPDDAEKQTSENEKDEER